MSSKQVDPKSQRGRTVPLFPLPDIVLFPRMRLPLHVFEPRYRRLVSDTLRGDRVIAIPRLRPGFEKDYHDAPAVFEVCGIGTITRHHRLPDGRSNILVEGIERVRLLDEVRREPYRLARVVPLEERVVASTAVVSALRNELTSQVRRLLPHLTKPIDMLEDILRQSSSSSQFADALSALLVSDPDARQRLLEELDPVERLTELIARLHELLALAGADQHRDDELN